MKIVAKATVQQKGVIFANGVLSVEERESLAQPTASSPTTKSDALVRISQVFDFIATSIE